MKKSRNGTFKYILLMLLALYALSQIMLLVWGLWNTVKSADEFRANPLWPPSSPTLENLLNVLTVMDVRVVLPDQRIGYVPMWIQAVYSVIYALGCALASATVCCIVAYATSKFPYKRINGIIFNIVIVTMVLPIVGSLPSELNVARSLGLYNKLWGPIIMKANFLGIYYLVFFAAFKSLPDSFSEAAHIDGASEWTVMARINLPLVRNAFLTILLIRFIEYWGDYQIPLVYIPSYPTLARGIYDFSLSAGTRYSTVPMKLAGCFVLLLPVLTLFLIFHNKLVGNIRVGGLKE